MLRWRLRSILKAVLPMKLRRKVRDAQAAQRAPRMPTARDSGALDCVLVTAADGTIVCAPPGADLSVATESVAVSAGALLVRNIGYGPDLPRLAASGQPVWAIEPDPDTRRYARITAILNRLDAVQVVASEADIDRRRPAA